MAFVIIPTLNEENSIAPLVVGLRLKGHKVLVVDGGSADDTASDAAWAGATILKQDKPNYRNQMMAGWEVALNSGEGRIVQMDAGRSHDFKDLDTLLEVDADLVLGSRFMSNASYTGNPIRAFQSRLATFMLNWARHTRYTDWTSGYRVWKREALQRMRQGTQWYLTSGHSWQIEVLFEAGEIPLSVAEAPIHYKAGRSYMKLKDQMDAFGLWLRIFFTGPELNENGRRYQ